MIFYKECSCLFFKIFQKALRVIEHISLLSSSLLLSYRVIIFFFPSCLFRNLSLWRNFFLFDNCSEPTIRAINHDLKEVATHIKYLHCAGGYLEDEHMRYMAKIHLTIPNISRLENSS